jgi:hypothetical protein
MDRISVPGEPALTKTVGIPPVEVELPITFSRSWLRKLFGPAQAALGLLGGFLAVLVLLVTPDTLSTHGLLWAVLFTCLAVMVAVLAAAFLQSAVSNIAVDFFEKEGVLSITSEGILDRRISLHRIAWPEIRSGKKVVFQGHLGGISVVSNREIAPRWFRFDIKLKGLLRKNGRHWPSYFIDTRYFGMNMSTYLLSETILALIDRGAGGRSSLSPSGDG